MKFTVIMITEDQQDIKYDDDFDSLEIEDLRPEDAANLLLAYDEDSNYLQKSNLKKYKKVNDLLGHELFKKDSKLNVEKVWDYYKELKKLFSDGKYEVVTDPLNEI